MNIGENFYNYSNCNEEIRKYKIIDKTDDEDYYVEDLKTGYKYWWYYEMYDLDTIYKLKQTGFLNEIILSQEKIKYAKQKLKEIEEYYKKEKEMNEKEVCKHCDHFRPDENFCAFTNRKLTEWEINNDSGICFYPKEKEK